MKYTQETSSGGSTYTLHFLLWGNYLGWQGNRVAENYLFEEVKTKGFVGRNKTMKAYFNAKEVCKNISEHNYNTKDNNKFLVHVSGLLGKLPKSEDI